MNQKKRYQLDKVEGLLVLGRSAACKSPLALFYSGSGFEVFYTGTELFCVLEADYSSHEQWIAVEVNGVVIARQMLLHGIQEICLFRNPVNTGVNRIRLLKEVQAMPGDEQAYLLVHSLSGDGTFIKGEDKSLRLEFIGDSITSGEGSYGAKNEQDWISMWFSATHAYPYLTANQLSADFRIFSQSGYGVFCAWDGNTENVLPPYYEQVCGVLKGEKNKQLGAHQAYDFASWQPDAILINLGTNDANAFTQPPFINKITGEVNRMDSDENGEPKAECAEKISNAVIAFLKTVRKNNPKAELLWCYGLMENRVQKAIEKGIEFFQKESGDKKVQFFSFTRMTEAQTGARSHPSVAAHEMAAKELSEKLSQMFQKK